MILNNSVLCYFGVLSKVQCFNDLDQFNARLATKLYLKEGSVPVTCGQTSDKRNVCIKFPVKYFSISLVCGSVSSLCCVC